MNLLQDDSVFVRAICRLTSLGMLALLMSGCEQSGASGNDGSGNPTPLQGHVTTVASLELSLNIEYPSRSFYTGRVEAARRSDLGFELGGLLKSVAVDEGDTVKEGEVLARLDTDRLSAQLEEAQAGVAQADARLKLARSTMDRLVEARAFDGISQQQLDEAGNGVASAEASLQAAASRLSRVRVDMDKARLLAPYDAVVLQRNYDEGQVLAAGQAVLRIQDTASLQVRIGVAGSATNQLDVGGYTLIINDRPVRATLRAIIPVRDAVSRTVDVVFAIDTAMNESNEAEPARLQAGDLAQLELRRTIKADGYWVPLTALAEGDRGLWNTYVVVNQAQDGKPVSVVQARAVEVLYQDGSRAYVNGAIKPGDLIVPSGLNRIVPGQRVNVQRNGL